MADFTTSGDYVIEKVQQSFVESEFENGSVQRRSIWGTPRRGWEEGFNGRTKAEMITIRDFFLLKASGDTTSFTWNNPNDGVDYTVYFKEDTLEIEPIGPELFNIKFELIQVK